MASPGICGYSVKYKDRSKLNLKRIFVGLQWRGDSKRRVGQQYMLMRSSNERGLCSYKPKRKSYDSSKTVTMRKGDGRDLHRKFIHVYIYVCVCFKIQNYSERKEITTLDLNFFFFKSLSKVDVVLTVNTSRKKKKWQIMTRF